MSEIKGYVSSIQSMGTVDGPGIRYVVFMQGCPLRCACCHNPETWETVGGEEYTADELLQKVIRYKEYFGNEGGITLSGGEPLMQPEFAAEVFKKCRENGINTCLDTSGYILDERVKEVLKYTDYCMLDIKYTTDEKYKKYTGIGINKPLEFLEYLEEKGMPTRIRQVIIEGLNDDKENIKALAEIIENHRCVEKTELLAFRKLCTSKYENLGLRFPLLNTPETSKEKIEELMRELA